MRAIIKISIGAIIIIIRATNFQMALKYDIAVDRK